MTNQIFTMMTDSSTFPFDSLQELNDINTRALNKLARLQISFARLGIETSVEQAKLLTDVNGYDDFLSAGSELASSYSNKITGLTREVTDILSESQEELLAWMENRFEESKKEIATATESEPKPAAKKTSTTKSSSRKKVA